MEIIIWLLLLSVFLGITSSRYIWVTKLKKRDRSATIESLRERWYYNIYATGISAMLLILNIAFLNHSILQNLMVINTLGSGMLSGYIIFNTYSMMSMMKTN